MFVALLSLALITCMGLFAALRPETYTRYFLAEYQRKALSNNLKTVSLVGWLVVSCCTVVPLPFLFHNVLTVIAPVFSPVPFLICAVAYFWWGAALLRKPESFLERATAPWNRLPAWAITFFGFLLLFGAVGFSYGFIVKILVLVR